MILSFITNKPDVAEFAIKCGVNRIMVDMEYLGKMDRQGHLDTHITRHSCADIRAIRAAARNAEILARINPIHVDTGKEVSDAIEAGADVIMLPMFSHAEEVKALISCVQRKARICLLVETPGALARLDTVLALSEGFDEIHIGLNDLHLGMGLDFMFEPLAGGLLDSAAERIHKERIRLGIGGVAGIGKGAVPAELVLGEHVRLGSKMAILSRTFHQKASSVSDLKARVDLEKEIHLLRSNYDRLLKAPASVIEKNQQAFQEAVWKVVDERRKERLALRP